MNSKIYLLIALVIISISSCSKKDPEPEAAPHPIIGQWKPLYLKEGLFNLPQMDPALPTNFSQNFPFRDTLMLDFQPNNIYKEIHVINALPNIYTSNYILNGNKIVFTDNNVINNSFFSSERIYIDSLTSTRLVLRDSIYYPDFKLLKVWIITAIK
jgi:hypothetical protein